MTVEELAQGFIKDYEENSMLFYKNRVQNLSEEDLKLLEEILLKKIPNLIITHFSEDTDEDIRNQVDRIYQIIDSGNAPYFIDFSREKRKTKVKC